MKSKEFYPAVFSRYALPYKLRHDEIDAQGHNRGRGWMMEQVGPRPGERVLDLACGPGKLTRRLADSVGPGGTVVGVDLAPGMLELARAAVPEATFMAMDIESLELEDATFDAAVCGHGLQFCSSLDAALGEARRVLKPGGRFGASVSAGAAGSRAWQTLASVLDERLPPEPEVEDNKATRRVVADLDAFTGAALRAGFSVARGERVEDTTVWRDPAHLVSVSLGWWTLAVRLEALDDAGRRDLMEESIARLRADLGDGPIEVAGVDHVIYAER